MSRFSRVPIAVVAALLLVVACAPLSAEIKPADETEIFVDIQKEIGESWAISIDQSDGQAWFRSVPAELPASRGFCFFHQIAIDRPRSEEPPQFSENILLNGIQTFISIRKDPNDCPSPSNSSYFEIDGFIGERFDMRLLRLISRIESGESVRSPENFKLEVESPEILDCLSGDGVYHLDITYVEPKYVILNMDVVRALGICQDTRLASDTMLEVEVLVKDAMSSPKIIAKQRRKLIEPP